MIASAPWRVPLRHPRSPYVVPVSLRVMEPRELSESRKRDEPRSRLFVATVNRT